MIMKSTCKRSECSISVAGGMQCEKRSGSFHGARTITAYNRRSKSSRRWVSGTCNVNAKDFRTNTIVLLTRLRKNRQQV